MTIYRVLVCGARDWTDRNIIADTLRGIALQAAKRGDLLEIVHGGASGADRIAGEIGAQIGATVHAMPAEWSSFGRAAGPIRNRQMLEQLRPSLVVAFHEHIETSRGTADMIRAATRAGVQWLLISHEETTEQRSIWK